MGHNLLMNFTVDKENNKIRVEREFAATRDRVWAAWTKSELLDQWWAPKPWKAETKVMDFSDGGFWLYAMVGPDGSKHWARADFEKIRELESFSTFDAFCDENGTVDTSFERSFWTNTFKEQSGSTIVNIEIVYKSLEDLEKIIAMGFKEGFTAGLENLDALLAS
ncbi:SRPBCC domain-containing protein [Flavobacterium lindanitolerans]|uniref:SRPBCC family protein n=1 Tax=Flavobacterium lindanitolerans TaxID=428988 RepID=UPI0028094BB5|nr:SRPBCC domain-containing protein [Flavobacterium lindanitolerans]MDQ7961271.1 SRPBCC domain-containing protein [Flavobacterium lindanitolerans]